MAKFELPVYDMKTETVTKTLQRNLIPVDLFIRYQAVSEKLVAEKINSDAELFLALKEIFLETFSELTEEEYMHSLEVSDVLTMYKNIISKSATFDSGKNA